MFTLLDLCIQLGRAGREFPPGQSEANTPKLRIWTFPDAEFQRKFWNVFIGRIVAAEISVGVLVLKNGL